ncbi:anhydro-N-acetylmuramic acid kinase [Flavobacterium terrae]|uniref:Anhydro-N-acetylmuramic acid kinase n=1 Tax=Flavobacterium terrae TaxID=415425 RepID=A0A1M6GPY8_9FLAO|nr:anhydro-N-acetylmuramic acid kinase [Flavobacterium terrae]SHJ12013.1 anhydro-N-acetylmuramic acid kinase [Flavobacterium terrae]
MQNASYNVVGVMSGTSLDGVDLAHINFTIKGGKWYFEIHESETVSYTEEWINRLKNAVDFTETELKSLNKDYTALLSQIIKNFISRYKIENLDAVCSHGHTILHQPHKGITLQIGNLPEIAELIGQNIVCDFRVQDVKMGGQGAPLVPIGDRTLFSDYDYCLNLGGFSNISFEEKGNRIAFDISPVNTVLNFYAEKLGHKYDDKGDWARSGSINQKLFDELNDFEFYKKKYPKSLGFEFVKTLVLPLIDEFRISERDKLRTFVEHISLQISLALPLKKGKILVTGGGAYNDFLLERMKIYMPNLEIVIPNSKIIEFKEALIFALLGVLKIRNEVNVLSSVTGANHNHSSGEIFLA